VAVYPVGSVVTLETGEAGEVVGATQVLTRVLVTSGPRCGMTLTCPEEAEIVRRRTWGAPAGR
jgi:hypothetical protein